MLERVVMAPVRSKENFLVFGAPALGEEEIDEVLSTLRSGWIGTGPRVARFESDFARYRGAEHAVAVSSCTAALHLSMVVAQLGEGAEVITTPLTFCSTVNAIIHAKATPVLADVDPATMNLDVATVRAAITEKTRAIVPVHFAGRPCDMDGLRAIADEYDLLIIEDCAHAVEATWKGQSVGTLGDFGCFSFYATKNVTTGEGGMVLTRHEAFASRIKTLALHGMSKDAWKRFSDEGYRHYYVTEPGFKNNMTDLQAALGIHQLARVEANWMKRKAVWDYYQSALKDFPVTLPTEPGPAMRHAFHLFPMLIDTQEAGLTRDAFLDGITQENIGVGVHYLSIPEHPYYRDTYGWNPEDYPHAMSIGRRTVSLPLAANLTEADCADVVVATRRVLGG